MTQDLDALARRAARGDADAFDVLCRTLNDEVWRYCRALTGDRELAFEAAQDTFVRLVPAIRRFRGDSPVRPFVLTIARRSAAATQRAARSAPASSEVGAHLPPAPDHSRATDTMLLLADLPDDLRDAFVLTQLIGLPYDQTAQVCGCPIGTVRSRVFRARERLIAALQSSADDPGQEADHV